MSETMTRIDPKAELAGWTRRLGEMYIKDLRALPQEQVTATCGGESRSPNNITAEIVTFTNFVAATVRGENPQLPEDPAFYMNQINELAASIVKTEDAEKAVRDAVEALASAVETASDEQLTARVTAPWGEPMSAYTLANIGANHIWYHDGQLNLIQCINGDTAVHWMD